MKVVDFVKKAAQNDVYGYICIEFAGLRTNIISDRIYICVVEVGMEGFVGWSPLFNVLSIKQKKGP